MSGVSVGFDSGMDVGSDSGSLPVQASTVKAAITKKISDAIRICSSQVFPYIPDSYSPASTSLRSSIRAWLEMRRLMVMRRGGTRSSSSLMTWGPA